MNDQTKPCQGQCLCGAVKFTAAAKSTSVGVCHCNICRTWGGGPFMTVDCGTQVQFENREPIAVYDSSEWADRGFCRECGTHLFYRVKGNQQYIMPAGVFEEDPDHVFDHEVFVDERPDYYHFANKTEQMTGEEVFAKFAPPQ